MPKVTLGDGRSLTVGDEFTKLSPADQQSWVNDVASSLPPPGPPPQDTGGTGISIHPVNQPPTTAQNIGSAIKGGYQAFDAGTAAALAGLGGAPGEIARLAEKGLYGATDLANKFFGYPEYKHPEASITDYLPKTKDVQDFIQKTYYGGEKPYEPQNLPERYLKTAGEFLPGILAGGPETGLITRGLAQVAAPAITSETAGHIPGIEGTKAEPVARFVGALAGGGAGALLSPASSTREALLRQLPKGVTPQMVDSADSLIKDAQTKGVTLTWPEALSQVAGKPVMTDLQRHLEASADSAPTMQAALGDRPQQITAAGDQAISGLSPGIPGPTASIGPEVGRTAESIARNAEQIRTAKVDPFYQAAKTDHVPGPEIQGFINNLDQAIAADKTGIIGGRLQEIKQLLTEKPAQPAIPPTRTARQTPSGQIFTTTPGQPAVPATYLTDIDNLDRVRKYVRDKMEMPQFGVDAITKEQGKAIGNALDDLKKRMIANSQKYATGKQLFQDITEKYIRPLMEGPIGKLADKSLETQNAIKVLFQKGEQTYSSKEVGNAVRAVANRSPKAASDLVKTYAQRTFDNAARDLQSGPNPAGGAKFRAQIFGSLQQRANLQAAVEALPNGAERWAGFNNFLDIMEATGTRQNIGSKTAYNQEIRRAMETKGGVADVTLKGLGKPTQFFNPLIEKYQLWKVGKQLKGLAEAITDPASGDMLRELAQTSPMSHRAITLSNSLVNYTNAVNARSNQGKTP